MPNNAPIGISENELSKLMPMALPNLLPSIEEIEKGQKENTKSEPVSYYFNLYMQKRTVIKSYVY